MQYMYILYFMHVDIFTPYLPEYFVLNVFFFKKIRKDKKTNIVEKIREDEEKITNIIILLL